MSFLLIHIHLINPLTSGLQISPEALEAAVISLRSQTSPRSGRRGQTQFVFSGRPVYLVSDGRSVCMQVSVNV